MLVSEIMTSPAYSVHEGDDLDSALQLMAEKKITALPVVDDNAHVVGVLSEVDLLRRAVEPDLRAHLAPVPQPSALPKTVGEIMTAPARTSSEHADINDLVQLFINSKFKSLPVVRDHKLVGVISRSDVIRALWRPDHDLLDDLRAEFNDQGFTDWYLDVNHGVAEVTGPIGMRQAAIADAVARSVLGIRRVKVIAG